MVFTVDTILKLVSELSTTFIFCSLGSWIRAIVKSAKNQEKIDIREIIASIVFSTFLMCSCAQYFNLPVEVYATISIVCGMWGKVFINLLINEKFMKNIFKNMTKFITAPIVKEVVKTATEVMEPEDNKPESKIDDKIYQEETNRGSLKQENDIKQLPDNLSSTLDK